MILGIDVKYQGPVPGITLKRATFNRLLKAAWGHTGLHWHQNMLPGHFTAMGARKYDYTPRKGQRSGMSQKEFWRSYTGQKKRKMGHADPLVWSGRSRDEAMRPDIRPTSRGVRVVLHAPALNFRHPNSEIDMRDEVTRITPEEVVELTREFDRFIESELRAFRGTVTRKLS